MRKRFPSVRVAGVRVDALDVRRLHAFIHHAIVRGWRVPVFYANAYAVVLAHDDPAFARVLEAAPIVLCDGSGTRLGARLVGAELPPRITYADWIDELAPFLRDQGHSLFLLGGRPGVAEEAARRLALRYPGIRIVGTENGYFRKDGPENDAVVAALNAARPDVLLLGFGMPLQETWCMANLDRLDVRVVLAGGACIDYVAGALRRGPRILVDHHMEWLARLLVEPRRLWRRYLLGNPRFLYLVLRERLRRWTRGRVDDEGGEE